VTAYLLRRLFAVIPVMFVVVTVIFLLIHLIPGDPVAVMLGPDATPRQIAQVRSTYGLDRPLHLQLLKWYGRVLQGDLGESYFLGRTVLQAMLERLEPTMVLTVLALFVAVIIGIPAGVIAAAHPHSPWDRLLMAVALLGVCIPSFWLALNFIYLFAVQLKWLPAMGYIPLSQGLGRTLRYMLLPAVSLGFNQSALIARIARSCMLEVMRQDYIRTARAKGLAERVVIYIHALRNAMIPTVTVIGITFAILIGGAVVTEVVFNIPGLGRLIISAILRRDYPVVQGCVLFLTMTYVLINLCVDVIYVFIDPRIKYD
jgi:peptide/nickel transport system permease protein